MTIDVRDLNESVKKINGPFKKLQEEVGKVIVGQKDLVQRMTLALLTGGHLLLEGLPGLAKTLAVNTIAKALHCDFKRIQFTPDLLPADLIGTSIYNPKDGSFSVKKGPLFTNFVLADEINRAPPKVQAALLEVMQEKQVTIGNETFKADPPFLVMATQNPIEQEGTYPLPEAQTDRFMMKVKISYPSKEEEKEILSRMALRAPKTEIKGVMTKEQLFEGQKLLDEIYVDEKIANYILDVVFATRNPSSYGLDFDELIEFGASPRASIYLVLAGKAHAFLSDRGYVTPHDIKSLAFDILRHRIKISYEGEAEGLTSEGFIQKVLETIPVP